MPISQEMAFLGQHGCKGGTKMPISQEMAFLVF